MALANVKVNRMCAFCRHWYDPANMEISPKSPSIGIWEYDVKAFRKCLVKGLNMPSTASCVKYDCKV